MESARAPVTVRFQRLKGKSGRPAAEIVQGIKPPNGKCRERDYINTTPEINGGTALVIESSRSTSKPVAKT